MIQGIERRKMFPFNALGSLLFALCPQCRPNKPGGPPAMSQEIEIEMPLDGDLRLFSLKTPSLSEAPLAAARSIFTSSAEPAEADPPSPTPAAEAMAVKRLRWISFSHSSPPFRTGLSAKAGKSRACSSLRSQRTLPTRNTPVHRNPSALNMMGQVCP